MAREVLAEAGATSPFLGYQPSFAHSPFPGVICASVNDVALHGIPGSYRLADGDLRRCRRRGDLELSDGAAEIGRPLLQRRLKGLGAGRGTQTLRECIEGTMLLAAESEPGTPLVPSITSVTPTGLKAIG